MSFNSAKHHRHSIRLPGYDYAAAGAYFVTICAHHKRCVFGRVRVGTMQSNVYGRIVSEEWERSAQLRPNITLDEWVVMPNHFHAIVFLHCDTETHHTVSPSLSRAPRSLSSLMSGFKGAVTRAINFQRAERQWSPVVVWQRNYHEHIIRNETELLETRRYLIQNPLFWARDAENLNPDNTL